MTARFLSCPKCSTKIRASESGFQADMLDHIVDRHTGRNMDAAYALLRTVDEFRDIEAWEHEILDGAQ